MKDLPTAKLVRTYFPTYTRGIFTFGDQSKVCLERPWFGNQHDISCIPEGIYRCSWGRMVKHNVNHYEVHGVDGRDGIFIHRGVRVFDSLGCPMLGESFDVSGELIGTRGAINDLEMFFRQDPFMLEITSEHHAE